MLRTFPYAIAGAVGFGLGVVVWRKGSQCAVKCVRDILLALPLIYLV